MKKLKVGICGLNRGRAHLINLLKNDRYEVVAICDIDREKTDMMVETYGKNIKAYYDHRDLCADKDVEAVIMATPIDVHAETVIDALNAGKHVLSEVIVATTIDDIYRIGEAIKKSGKTYMMAENYCYIRPMLIVENLVKNGLLGEIYYAESDYLKDFQEYHPNFPNIGGWRQKTYFGRRGHPYITHSIGPLLHIMKEKVVNVTAMAAGRSFDMVADNMCAMTLETEKGHLIKLRSSFVSPRPDNVTYYAFQGMNGCYQAPQGPTDFHKIYIPEFWHKYWDIANYENKLDNNTYELYDSGLYCMLDKFADCILNGEEVPVSFEDAANWTAAGLLSADSVNKGGKPVSIPLFDKI